MIVIPLVILFILLLFYAFFINSVYNGLTKLVTNGTNKSKISVSVVIPLKNESHNIERLCTNLSKQDYTGKWEIIFVDDDSNDNTINLLEKFKPGNSLIISSCNTVNGRARKKIAIEEGIKKSTGEIIVVTDADCIHKRGWLKSMVGFFDESTGVVAGPVDLSAGETLLGKFQRLEYASLILTGAGLIGIGRPTICSASNLAYRRKVFDEVDGFKNQLHFTSGDDDLFIQKVSRLTDYKINFAFTKDALVKTEAQRSIDDFLNQRKRWASKSLFYEDKKLVLKIILIALFYIALILQPILGFLYSYEFIMSFMVSFFVKIIFEYRVIKFGIERLYEKKMLNIFLLAELMQIPYIVYSGIAGMFGNFVWKGNKVKR